MFFLLHSFVMSFAHLDFSILHRTLCRCFCPVSFKKPWKPAFRDNYRMVSLPVFARAWRWNGLEILPHRYSGLVSSPYKPWATTGILKSRMTNSNRPWKMYWIWIRMEKAIWNKRRIRYWECWPIICHLALPLWVDSWAGFGLKTVPSSSRRQMRCKTKDGGNTSICTSYSIKGHSRIGSRLPNVCKGINKPAKLINCAAELNKMSLVKNLNMKTQAPLYLVAIR